MLNISSNKEALIQSMRDHFAEVIGPSAVATDIYHHLEHLINDMHNLSERIRYLEEKEK